MTLLIENYLAQTVKIYTFSAYYDIFHFLYELRFLAHSLFCFPNCSRCLYLPGNYPTVAIVSNEIDGDISCLSGITLYVCCVAEL